MDKYSGVLAKLLKEVDESIPVTLWREGEYFNSEGLASACKYENI